ncbi:hypothetical protein LTR16_001388, partial [Cryomyces antarcticus]
MNQSTNSRTLLCEDSEDIANQLMNVDQRFRTAAFRILESTGSRTCGHVLCSNSNPTARDAFYDEMDLAIARPSLEGRLLQFPVNDDDGQPVPRATRLFPLRPCLRQPSTVLAAEAGGVSGTTAPSPIPASSARVTLSEDRNSIHSAPSLSSLQTPTRSPIHVAPEYTVVQVPDGISAQGATSNRSPLLDLIIDKPREESPFGFLPESDFDTLRERADIANAASEIEAAHTSGTPTGSCGLKLQRELRILGDALSPPEEDVAPNNDTPGADENAHPSADTRFAANKPMTLMAGPLLSTPMAMSPPTSRSREASKATLYDEQPPIDLESAVNVSTAQVASQPSS